MTARELFERAPKAHRRAVALALGLGKGATGADVAAALLDAERLCPLVSSLSPLPRALAGRLAFGDCSVSYYGATGSTAPAHELERYGLVYAFEPNAWMREYHLPADLAAPLRHALAALHARTIAAGGAARFVAAPLQTAHDAAALAAFLERSPARVKADGDVYQRVWPKLAAALPPLEALDDGLAGDRVEGALRFLRQEGFLRVRVDDRPGGDGRRELVPAGDLAAGLAVDGDELRARLIACAEQSAATSRASALVGALPGAVVELAGFGRALHALLEETGTRVADGWRDEALALLGLAPLWLAGAVELGLDTAGRATAACLRAVEPAGAEGPPAVCQGNFELVLLRLPSPAERLALERLCEREPRQAHVYRLTKASVRTAASSGLGAAGVLARLGELAGELPQNVARSVADWAGSARSFRLRSALFLDARDPAVADELAAGPLRGMVAERLGDRLLAVAASEVATVERKLAAAGHVLEPGLDRASGAWHEPSASRDADYLWRPTTRQSRAPQGRQVSTLGGSPSAATPRDVIAEALRTGRDLEIVRSDGDGTTVGTVTPVELAANRLKAWCYECDRLHAFALDTIEQASLAA